MAKAKIQSNSSFIKKSRSSCNRHSKSKTSNNKGSKKYVKAYRGQGK